MTWEELLKKENATIDEILNAELPKRNGQYFGWEGWPKISEWDLKDYQGR
ncbi:hypothetical protein [Paenibacillus spiritus]|nr:hypothetical protein [Paenibacillus spiritus]